MTPRQKRSKKLIPKPNQPSAKSLQDDIMHLEKAIAATKKVANLTGMRAILTSLYGEKRFAENLLRTKYPRLIKAPSSNVGKKARTKKQVSGMKEPPQVIVTTKSQKLMRGWRFIDAVKKNYSNDPIIAKMSKKQLRSEFKKFREGRESRVSDIAWYNPSP